MTNVKCVSNRALLGIVLLFSLGTNGASQQSQSGDESTKEREELLRQMRKRVQAMKVSKVDDDVRVPVELLPNPLFRFSDERSPIIDGAVWCWGSQGRPVAMMKLTGYRDRERGSKWLYDMVSLSDGLIDAQWGDGHEWSSNKPGVRLKPLPDGLTPADTESRRLLQMKEISRRFTASTAHPYWGKDELRLLPRQICRYSDPGSGLEDGAIFTFAYSGTIPSVFLLVESRKQESSSPAWHYGVARQIDSAVTVRVDEKEVWTAPYVSAPGILDTWAWFWENTGER
jgi:hypothetical protein